MLIFIRVFCSVLCLCFLIKFKANCLERASSYASLSLYRWAFSTSSNVFGKCNFNNDLLKLCQFLSFNNSELIHSLNPGISEIEYFTAALIFLCDKPEVSGYVVS